MERGEIRLDREGVSLDYRVNFYSQNTPQAWVSIYEAYLPAGSPAQPSTGEAAEPAGQTPSATETPETVGQSAGSWDPIVQQQSQSTETAQPAPYQPRYPQDPQLEADIWRRGGKVLHRHTHNRRPAGSDPRPGMDEVVVRAEAVFYQMPMIKTIRHRRPPSTSGIDPDGALDRAPSYSGSAQVVTRTVETYLRGLVTIAEGRREYHVYYNVPITDSSHRSVIHRMLSDIDLRNSYPTRLYAVEFFEQEVPAFLEDHELPAETVEWQDEAEDGVQRREMPARTPAELSAGITSSEEMANLHRESLAIIEGNHGAGSAFLCNWGEHSYIVSNIHVVAGDRTGKAVTLYGAPLPTEEAWAAVGHDIMRFKARPSDKISLDVIEDFDTQVSIGDDIVVLGNPEGAGVVQPMFGRIVGIGPDRVEVDAEFVPGNSGSPIVHLPTGKVIAIATYIRVRDRTFIEQRTTDRPATKEFRRFGFRLDSVEDWQPVNWPVFFAQAAKISAAEKLSMDIINLLRDMGDGDGLNVYSHRNPAIQNHVRSYVERINENPRMSRSDRHRLAVRFISNLKTATTRDLPELKRQQLYDYFANILKQEEELREMLEEDFDQWLRLNLR